MLQGRLPTYRRPAARAGAAKLALVLVLLLLRGVLVLLLRSAGQRRGRHQGGAVKARKLLLVLLHG
jgi:hypothetical protein